MHFHMQFKFFQVLELIYTVQAKFFENLRSSLALRKCCVHFYVVLHIKKT